MIFSRLLLGSLACVSSITIAATQCSGSLTAAQQAGFEAMFVPAYSPSLTHMGGAISVDNMSKKLTAEEIQRRQKPLLVKNIALTGTRSTMLKNWLNANASATVPGWVSTGLGLAAPSAWAGITADVALQLINSAGDQGRLTLSNLAGTVSEGGEVGVYEQVANDSVGRKKFIWMYFYKAHLNSKDITNLLQVCSADVV